MGKENAIKPAMRRALMEDAQIILILSVYASDSIPTLVYL